MEQEIEEGRTAQGGGQGQCQIPAERVQTETRFGVPPRTLCLVTACLSSACHLDTTLGFPLPSTPQQPQEQCQAQRAEEDHLSAFDAI